MKTTILILSIAAVLFSSCQREEQTKCTKIVTTYGRGYVISSDTTSIFTLKGSSYSTEFIYNSSGGVDTTITTEINCGCN